jgi:hypothetical protein
MDEGIGAFCSGCFAQYNPVNGQFEWKKREEKEEKEEKAEKAENNEQTP